MIVDSKIGATLTAAQGAVAQEPTDAETSVAATDETTTDNIGAVTLADDVVTLSDGQVDEPLAGISRPVASASTTTEAEKMTGGSGDKGGPP